MAVKDQIITNDYALYCGDCMEVMPQLYQYSSNERDLSNSRDYAEFMKHYEYVVRELHRLTMPGRMTAVHCMDIPTGNTGRGDGLSDFPGDIIRMHEKVGWQYNARYHVWKEPLTVRNRTMKKALFRMQAGAA
jgi:thiol-disulfide isomerase/thioredoxin